MMRFRIRRSLVLAVAVAAVGCASTRAPTLMVSKLGFEKAGITGARLRVDFRVRNPNPEPLDVENFEYELKLNGQRLGRGYQSDGFHLAGFADRDVSSGFDLNYLSLPGSVRAILDRDSAKAEVKGKFYVRGDGGNLRALGFKSKADVRISR